MKDKELEISILEILIEHESDVTICGSVVGRINPRIYEYLAKEIIKLCKNQTK
jgi:hypothetical protein